MFDTGNFVLVSSNSSYLWQSFNNPTDTLLPTQTLDLNGDIYLQTRGGGQITLGWDNSVFDVNRYYYRATLDYYGVFTQYSHPKESSGDQVWSIERYVPDNICFAIFSDYGSGCCGYNSYCSIENRKPTCTCPYGYSLVDPNNQFGGCQPNFSLGCGVDDATSQHNPQEVYEFHVLQNVDWPLGDYEMLFNYTQDDCQNSCLYDCNCVVAVFDNRNTCWKKKLPLSNGRVTSGKGQTPLMKIRIRPMGNLGLAVKKEDQVQHTLLVLFIASLTINTLLVAIIIITILLKPKKVVQVLSLPETNLHSFTYATLKEATHGFNEEVGRGSFGIVYKGTLELAHNNVVAVKRLDRLAQE